MTKQTNPFMNFDVTKMFADFDPTKMADEFTKIAGQYKVPAFDVDAVMASQRKNIEALTAANTAAAEGMQQIAARQAQILQENLDAATKAVTDLTKSGSPKDVASKQTDLFKQAFENALANMRELADMVAKSNTEAANVVNDRIKENLDEIKTLAEKMSK